MSQHKSETILDIKGPSSTGGGDSTVEICESSSIREPQRETADQDKSQGSSSTDSAAQRGETQDKPLKAPEKKLTLFALRLAILEKLACSLGALGFIWATVVLLSGFAITLDTSDFWFITTILLIEGARIFSRSHELKWQHQATWSFRDAGINSFQAFKSRSDSAILTVRRKFNSLQPQSPCDQGLPRSDHVKKVTVPNIQKIPTRTWTASEVPLLPSAKGIFLSKSVSKLLCWLQLLSALACVILSLVKLIKHDFGEVSKGDSDKRNRKAALIIFYSLALSEAMLFLIEKVYWEWKVSYCRLLEEVNKECQFDAESGMVSVKRFLYDAYSKCLDGSVFNGLKMDLVSFGMELLASDSCDEQLTGSTILRKFVTNELYCGDTLQKIGTSVTTIERLVEMLNWKDVEHEKIRCSAAEILSKLASKKQNSLRVAGIPGAMESIASLLYYEPDARDASYDFSAFNNLGLLILKKLARDHDNCGKIENTRGLLSIIIDFTHADERFLRNDHLAVSQITTVKLSLQVIKRLVSTAGTTGKLLGRELSENAFTISNIREILLCGEKHSDLQELGIEILTSFAFQEEATERIGRTGGVLKELFRIFLSETQNRVKVLAGKALAVLVFESERNCQRVLEVDGLATLVSELENRVPSKTEARILRNLCAYSHLDCFNHLHGVISIGPTVLKAIMSEDKKVQEVMLGLASQVFKFMTSQESSEMFRKAGIQETELAEKLVQTMKQYSRPSIEVAGMRRFAIELAIWMMRDKKENIRIFKSLGIVQGLGCVIDTTSQVENFIVFTGSIGIDRHTPSIHSLVETGLKLLADE